jgi:hypothetical protein
MDIFGELVKTGEVGGLPFELENLSDNYIKYYLLNKERTCERKGRKIRKHTGESGTLVVLPDDERDRDN